MEATKVEIHTGIPDKPYKRLQEIEAKRSKRTAFSADPTLEEVNDELRQLAAQVGANAVIDVSYKRGMSLTSYGVLKASGLAVILESDNKPCPICAEPIKAAALKCRFCGADFGTTAF